MEQKGFQGGGRQGAGRSLPRVEMTPSDRAADIKKKGWTRAVFKESQASRQFLMGVCGDASWGD